MNEKEQLSVQTRRAFDFLDKLYLESSYLVKEIEGLLARCPTPFVICRPSGYGISTNRSAGLDSSYVPSWLMRSFSVFFIPEGRTRLSQGTTTTGIDDGLEVLFFRIVFAAPDITTPALYSGVLSEIRIRPQGVKWVSKFEHFSGYFGEYAGSIFGDRNDLKYEDADLEFRARWFRTDLFDIEASGELPEKVLGPTLALLAKS